MTEPTPYTVPKEGGRGRGLLLALAVHAVLLLLLWIGASWQSETPGTVEAEVWSLKPQAAAPRPQPQVATEP
ncbi:MAG TPA: protein TolA, partial [Noviherbaspirillum sp.]